MVSNASDDLPEPERPVTTVKELRGMETLMLRRLCWRAPRTVMSLIGNSRVGLAAVEKPVGLETSYLYDTGQQKRGANRITICDNDAVIETLTVYRGLECIIC